MDQEINKHCDWNICHFERKTKKKTEGHQDLITFLKVIEWKDNNSNNNESEDILLSCFTTIDMNMVSDDETLNDILIYELSLTQLKQQCEEQGYLDMNLMTIWKELSNQIYHVEYVYDCTTRQITFIIQLSSGQLELKIRLYQSSHYKDVEDMKSLYNNLVKQILYSGSIMRRNSIEQLNVIKEKDKVIEFLRDNLITLGGSNVIKKWAPKGSRNYKYYQPYEETDTSAIADEAEMNAHYFKEDIRFMINNYLKLNGYDMSKMAVNDSILQDSNNESIRNESESLSQSPRKRLKRSFGKVKVSKR